MVLALRNYLNDFRWRCMFVFFLQVRIDIRLRWQSRPDILPKKGFGRVPGKKNFRCGLLRGRNKMWSWLQFSTEKAVKRRDGEIYIYSMECHWWDSRMSSNDWDWGKLETILEQRGTEWGFASLKPTVDNVRIAVVDGQDIEFERFVLDSLLWGCLVSGT